MCKQTIFCSLSNKKTSNSSGTEFEREIGKKTGRNKQKN